jgi:hypothetical protein
LETRLAQQAQLQPQTWHAWSLQMPRFSYSAVKASIHLLDNQLALLLRDVLRDGAAHNRRAYDPNMRLLMLRSRKHVSPSTALSPHLIYQHNAWAQT